ncbi:Hsp70 family protein [Brevundimonas sp. Root1279]|uniref:Hsp70 family protein n=1 Tax=Brevundimonas sp. Root1279 TaxID=1736443 RepID=UPI0006F772C3|nr:Hsp70 family protein [Brevundimonas sp. Root1279]KQW82411.1 molecular chaperone Hsp70 [Brevundimonas sp. Root1279]
MTSATGPTVGIDFGTTNTVVAIAGSDGEAMVLRFEAPSGEVTAFRSTLSFQMRHGAGDRTPQRIVEAGPWAIDAYVEDAHDTRFIQSFKTFAASAAFTETVIDNRRYKFEDLLGAFLLRVRAHGGETMAALPARVIVGRPVTFAGGAPDEQLALDRYQAAFARLGFSDIRYAYEPVGAAFFFARTLEADATVLVADFGGGTSDFSVIRFERSADGLKSTALSRSGVGVAGDAFDYRIIDQLVSPQLGKGGRYRTFDKTLPIPQRYYAAFARWDQLALLRASKDMRDIRALARTAEEPDKLDRLVEILDDNHGYALYQAVSALKLDLSEHEVADFAFVAGSIRIEKTVTRQEFEGWIAPELAAIEAAVEDAVARSGLGAGQIDRIFLTGGTSFVPAVRAIFQRRFGGVPIETGGEFESIASGLALIGREPNLDDWSEARPAAA